MSNAYKGFLNSFDFDEKEKLLINIRNACEEKIVLLVTYKKVTWMILSHFSSK